MFARFAKFCGIMGLAAAVAMPAAADNIQGLEPNGNGSAAGVAPNPNPAGGGAMFMSEDQAFQAPQAAQAFEVAPGGQPRVKAAIVGQLQFGLRIDGFVQPGGGLVVNRVYSNSPARRMVGPYGYVYSLERGDRLEFVDGQYINTPTDYLMAVNLAATNPANPQKRVRLGVRDINDGQVKYFTAYLVRIN